MTAGKRIKEAPLSADHREIFFHLPDRFLIMFLNKFFVSFHCLRTAHSFCHHQILLGIQYHVFVLVFPHKIFPGFQLKGIVDQMNLEYLACHISKELHTFVRIYTPFSGTYRLEYSCCGRPDFLDREVLNTSLLQVLLDLGTQTCPPLVLINDSFSYVAGSVENRRFLLGPFRLASQIPAKYTQEVPPVSGAWLSSLSICSLSVLSANVLLLYNLFTAVPLTEEEWSAENCPQEYTNFELEENFSRQVFSNREMQIRHNPWGLPAEIRSKKTLGRRRQMVNIHRPVRPFCFLLCSPEFYLNIFSYFRYSLTSDLPEPSEVRQIRLPGLHL